MTKVRYILVLKKNTPFLDKKSAIQTSYECMYG